MKKNFIYALLGAIALTGAASLTACSSSDEIVDNPNYNPETNTVKAQFALSLADNVVKTRMSSANTQAEGTSSQFRGLQDIILIPFKSGSAADANLNGKVISLTEDGAAKTAGTSLNNDKNYLYTNVDVKTETNYFAFYAVAKPASSTEHVVGSLTATLPAADASSVTMNSIGFALKPIINSTEYSSKQTKANNVRDDLIAKLNQVLAVAGWKNSDNPTLLQLYASFSGMRVGSSEGVQKALQNLYTSANSITGDGATVAEAIKTAITSDLTSPKGESGTVKITESSGTLTFGDGYKDYPGLIGLPNGAARLQFNNGGTGSDTFSAIDSEILWTSSNATAPGKFVYPADLRYFVQTDIKTAESIYLDTNLDNAWSTIIGNSIYSGTAVSGTTRSIVLTKPIQYGVGRLEASIAQMSEGTYYDRKGQAVTIPDDGFTLTGIVIGGQKDVDWKFQPNGSTFYTIYDNAVTGVSTSKTAASALNHTLVLETAANQEVQVALQFTNNSTNAFVGADGIIYPGMTFYLIASLNPATTGGNATQPAGAGSTINQVFLQDYVTKVNFTINKGTATDGNNTGFGAAVSGLPDLTKSTMEFGLSVNLQWQPGLTFNVSI